MKAFKIEPMRKAPISSIVRKAMAFSPGFGGFAHHPPARAGEGERGNAHMIRPHGGKGPRNAVER